MNRDMSTTRVLGFIAFILGVVTLVLAALKVVSYNVVIGTIEVTGFEAAFGTENSDANIMVMLAYLLPVAGGVLALLATLVGEGRRLFNFLSLAGFVVGAILLFMVPQFMAWNLGDIVTVEPKMLNGLIYAMIPTILGGLTQVFLLIKSE